MGKPVLNPKLTEFKRCLRCKATKPSDQFGVDKRATDRRKGECKKCRNDIEKERRKTWNAEQKAAHSNRTNMYYRNSQRSRATHLVSSAKQRAEKRGLDFDITTDFIDCLLKAHGRCAATGIKFQYTDGKQRNQTPFSPSLDRRNNEGGYTFTNCQIVCTAYNLGKAHHNEIDFIAMCMAVAERNKDNVDAVRRMKELTE